MDDFQFLKEEISSQKFNKRIFYAKTANKYIELISIDMFIDKYMPYITNYVFKDENTEEVLTEYSNTFTNFLKYLGNENTLLNYLKIKNNKDNQNCEEKIKYNRSISLILKCFFEKFFIIDDEILRETSINNIKELLLELDKYNLLKIEIENYFYYLNDNNKNISENKEINEENVVLLLFYSFLYPFIQNNEQKIQNYCNKLKIILKNNNQPKKKRLIIQNIINIIPFIKKSLINLKDNKNENNEQNIINQNKYILKEILSSLNDVMDDKNLIISAGINYLYEIIIIYTIKNMTEIILFYDSYNNFLSNKEIDDIINNFIFKLENILNNESNLNIPLTWRIKVAYIENICQLKKFIIINNENYFNDYFSNVCQKILENINNNNNFNNTNNSNTDADLKISVLNHVEFFISTLPSFIQIFKNIASLESNVYVRTYLGAALNKILNNEQLYEIYQNTKNLNIILSNIFEIIQNIIEKEKYEVKYYALSSFELKFFNIVKDENNKMFILNKIIKLIIIALQTINEWRIRDNIFEKFDKFLTNENNFIKIISLFQNVKQKNNNYYNSLEILSNLRYLIQLFFNDKANIIRTKCLNLIYNIINIQKGNKLEKESCLIRIKEELIKYQYSLFNRNNNFEEGENFFNNISSLDKNKNYYIKIFFLESVKKFINLYSREEKNLIKDIIELIKNDKKYPKENIANNKINQNIDFIFGKLTEL